MTITAAAHTQPLTGERADLLDALHKHRGLFRVTVHGLSDEQARTRSTVSELTLGGLIKHVTQVEENWAQLRRRRPGRAAGHRLGERRLEQPAGRGRQVRRRLPAAGGRDPGRRARGVRRVAAATDALVATVDLDSSQPLPEAPWFTPGARWSARRVFTHILAETAQHAGHADIIREAIDGQKSMG